MNTTQEIESIDAALRLLAAVLEDAQPHEQDRVMKRIDELLDERNEFITP